MLFWLEKSMNHRIRVGMSLFKVWRNYQQKLHLNLGLSVPTGAVDQRGDTPMGSNV